MTTGWDAMVVTFWSGGMPMLDLWLTGKGVSVTGGSEGLDCALRFAQEGVKVAICARRREPSTGQA